MRQFIFGLCGAVFTLYVLYAGSGSTYGHEPAGVVLSYKTLPDEVRGREFDIQKLVGTINSRLPSLGEAKVTADDRFDVELYGQPDAATLDDIKGRIGVRTTLELRVVADTNHPNDKATVALAKRLPANETEVKRGDDLVAKWVPYSEKDLGSSFQPASGVVTRTAGKLPEVLVLIDPYNVSAKYMTSVMKSKDERGGYALSFNLSKEGSQRLEKLTSQNLPSPEMPDAYRRLGVIINGRLVSAPTLHSTISERAMISGASMTEKEIDQLVASLESSRTATAYPFELVSEKRVAKAEAVRP